VDDEVLETIRAAPRMIVSYDVKARRRTVCSLVQQHLWGREVSVRTKGGQKRYRYEGLVHRPGVERLGQSAFMMRREEAEQFTAFLQKLLVPHRTERIWVEA
jgi:hypothetical protein